MATTTDVYLTERSSLSENVVLKKAVKKKKIARSRAAQTGGCHYEQVCGRAMGQKGNGTVCVPRRESQLKMAVRNGLIWTADVASWAHVMSGLCYCRRPCLGLWPHCDWGLCWCPWLMVTIEVQTDAWGLGCHLGHVDIWGPCCHQVILIWVTCTVTQGHGDI